MKALAVKKIIFLAVCLTVWSACRGEAEKPATAAAAVELVPANSSPKQAQAKLQTVKLWIGTNELASEIARTPKQIETGMMWRTNMAEMEAMIFVFPIPHRSSFWMRNTLLPLSCAYIDSDGIILELHDMKPKDETPIPAGTNTVRYVLEVNKGWFERHGVKPGMLVTSEHGTLSKTFFGR